MSKTRLWAVIAALALGVGVIFAAGCGSSDDTTGSATGGGAGGDLGLKSSGELLVGSDIPYAPFEFGDPPDYEGFDVDLVNEIAKRLGLNVTFQDTPFPTIFVNLAADQFDMVASSATITPERQQTVDFSDPYYEAQQSLVVLPGSDIKSVDDLAGKTVAAQDGTTGETYANDETDAASVQQYPQGPDTINALKSGQVDAAILDQPVALEAIEKQGGIEQAATIPTGELYGLAFQQDNDALREAVNKQIKAMEADGTLDKIYQKWFQTNAPKNVVEGTTPPKD
ncbi:MAG: basic amino acid ABC transporter substrate-binding protein [Solirubrobacterales bacterium]